MAPSVPPQPRGRPNDGDRTPPTARHGADARAIAMAALHSECTRLLAVTVRGYDPAALCQDVYGLAANAEQSTLALLTGIQFERRLTEDDCAALRELLVEAGLLSPSDAVAERVVNVEMRIPETTPEGLARRAAFTRELLARKAAGAPNAPTIIYHPRLVLDVAGTLTAIVPDFLVAPPREAMYRTGEAKSFRDRGTALTNTSGVRLARFQAAVEVLALRDTLRALGAPASDVDVPPAFELVLRARVGARASLRTQGIPHEVEVVRATLSEAERRVADAERRIPSGESLATGAGLEAVPNHFTPQCRGHCGLAAACEAGGWAHGAPAVLGPTFERTAGVVGSIPRLIALLGGAAEPASEEERELLYGFACTYARLEREGVVTGTDVVGVQLRRNRGLRRAG